MSGVQIVEKAQHGHQYNSRGMCVSFELYVVYACTCAMAYI